MNLDDRSMCAEFAGWQEIYGQEDKDAPDRDELFSDHGCNGVEWALQASDGVIDCAIPHYESDPAAACSLLPKLQGEMNHRDFRLLCEDIGQQSTWDESQVCRLIVEAVRAVKDGAK